MNGRAYTMKNHRTRKPALCARYLLAKCKPTAPNTATDKAIGGYVLTWNAKTPRKATKTQPCNPRNLPIRDSALFAIEDPIDMHVKYYSFPPQRSEAEIFDLLAAIGIDKQEVVID